MSVSFGTFDYTVMGLTIIASMGIGLYHGFKGNKTPEDFAMGSRSMRPFPVALSLLATFMSANTILGYSGEVYGHGLELVWLIPGTTVAILFAIHVVLPVLYPLKLGTSNEYLQLRFGSPGLRITAFCMALLSMIVFMGLALYTPTLALATVTPLPYTTYIWIMGIVVTLYSAAGGYKGVVWADVFQMAVMVIGVIYVAALASEEAGGPVAVWNKATEGGRTRAANLDLSPYTRHTIWNVLLMTSISWIRHYSVAQANYQRISSVPTCQQAKRVLYYNIIGIAVFLLLVYYMGLSLYAVYAGCDPYARGLIKTKEQIAVYYVVDRLSHLPGLPGIFVATLLCACLSTLSSGLNTMATLLWSDLLANLHVFKEVSDFTAATVSKVLTIILGFIIMGLAFFTAKMGGIVQAGYIILGVMSGPLLGVYLLGMAVPFSNKIGAFTGVLSGWGICIWIAMGGLLYRTSPTLLSFSSNNCPISAQVSNTTSSSISAARNLISNVAANGTNMTECGMDSACLQPDSSSVSWAALYTISYTLYPLIGLSVCMAIGILVSLVTGRQDPKKVPARLVLPCLRKYVAPIHDTEKEEPPQFALPRFSTVHIDSPYVSTENFCYHDKY